MPELTGLYAFRGKPLTLVGDDVSVGDTAPDFTLIDTSFRPTKLSDAKGKVVVLSVVLSLDTGVCATQLRTFNEAMAGLGDDVVVWNVSRDLPFALSRFCGSEGIENAAALSDYKDHEFGERYGVHVKEDALLARSVWVIDRNGKVVYKQIVPELSAEPDYEPALAAARAAL